MEEKLAQRQQDYLISQQYIDMVNIQEQKKREDLLKRETKIRDFMAMAEQTVFAEENKKHKLLEDNYRKYEEQKQKAEQFENERKRHLLLQH